MTKEAFVRIYCKILTDDFPDEGFSSGKVADGDTIYSFLTRELRLAFIDDGSIECKPIPGDHALWYLATNEKFGVLQVNELISEWSFGESNWQRVTEFIEILYAQGIISISQFEDLIRLTQEGMNAFDDMYLIPYYLEAKHKGQTWIKQQTDTKEVMKRMTQGITQSLVSHNYQIANP